LLFGDLFGTPGLTAGLVMVMGVDELGGFGTVGTRLPKPNCFPSNGQFVATSYCAVARLIRCSHPDRDETVEGGVPETNLLGATA
jgi:hypothetical protein